MKIVYFIQNEYMCDTVISPAQADGFGDYVIIPEGVDSSTSKVDGCIFSNHPAKIPVPSISKFCGNKLSCILNNKVSAEVIR